MIFIYSGAYTVPNFPRVQVLPQIDPEGLVISGESLRGGHQLESAAGCGRQWGLKYKYKVDRISCPEFTNKVPAWKLGNLVHQGAANWLARGMMCDQAADFRAAIDIRSQRDACTVAADQAMTLTHDYMSWVEEEYPSWVCMAIEPEIIGDYGALGVLTVGADAIYWDRQALEPVIVDWKTAGRVASGPNYQYSTQYNRYRMVLRTVARAAGKPDNWGQVVIGLIPTGKTNFAKKDLIQCKYIPRVIDELEQQTYMQLRTLDWLEKQDKADVVRQIFHQGDRCNGVYSPCAFRDSHCFLGGTHK